MENSKFKSLKKDYKYAYSNQTVAAGAVFFTTNGYGTVKHATANEAQSNGSNSQMEFEPSSDRDLLKLWSHATIERKYGVYATKEPLRKELESRGYVLNETGHRWKKPETTSVE